MSIPAALADLHQARVELGWHTWVPASETREPTLADVRTALNVCNAFERLAGGATARAISDTSDVLTRIAVRVSLRGGVLGLDRDALRGCMADLSVLCG
jgi:hypothetical protein